MNKLRIIGIILFIFSIMTTIQAQSYNRLWKQVEEQEKKDLPKSVIAEAQKIFEKAKAEKNAPQMMKAYLTLMAYRGEIAPDSIEVDRNYLKEWAEDKATSVVDKAVLHSILAGLYIEQDFEKGNAYLLASLKDSLTLFEYPAGKLVPMVKVGTTSRLYFDDNLYDLLSRRAIDLWREHQWRTERTKVEEEISKIYQVLLDHYEKTSKRSAWLLTALDADSGADEAKLRTWIKEYGDWDVCAEVYIRLAQRMAHEDNPAERLEVVREGIRRYPNYNRVNVLKNMEKEILSPRVSVTIPSAYPDKPIKVSVNYRNLERLDVEIYQLRLEADSKELPKVNEKTVKKYGTLYRKETIDLLPTPDYRMTDTLAYLKPLPEGVYYVIMMDKTCAVKDGTWLMVNAEMEIYRPLPDKKVEMVILDKETGKPNKVSISKEKERWNRYNYSDNDLKRIKVSLFTDRAIYRPGQTVYFSGLVYEQQQDSVKVMKGKSMQVSLLDDNYKKVNTLELKTNDFGTFSQSFVLPKDCQTGVWLIKATSTTVSIRVEEYKRPTFEVTFNPVNTTYQAGDSIQITGKATTFAGAPVQNARVNYDITCMENTWWRMRGSTVHRTEGEALTDADGCFTIPVRFLPSPDEKKYWYYTYAVSAQVTSMAGETQMGELTLPLGSSSLRLNVNHWKETFVKEQPEKISVDVQNLMGQPIATMVDCKVFKGEQSLLSFEVKSNDPFTSDIFKPLPSGEYTMKVSAKDEQGNVCEESYPFVLFSLKDTRVPCDEMEWNYQTSDTFPASLYFGTKEKDVIVFYDVFSGNKRLESKQIALSDSLLRLDFDYKEEYGDGVMVSMAFVKNSQLYHQYFTIKKPQPDKDLQLKWTTFRDKLQPGSKETWTLQVAYPNGASADAELLATMYDASLDNFAPHKWNFRLLFNRNIPHTSWRVEGNNPSWLNLNFPLRSLKTAPLDYSELIIPFRTDVWTGGMVMYSARSSKALNEMIVITENNADEEMVELKQSDVIDEKSADNKMLRTNFNETAFFYPNLRTDANGEVKIEFTLPESLTTWKFMGLAHTKDMDYGQIASEVVASKEFMLQPNMPRFVRIGDEVSLSASLINQSDKDVIGNVRMELFNPATDKVYMVKKQRFLITPNATTTVHFGFEVSEEYTDLAVRWIAEGDTFSDGEQRVLPVLSNKQQITESVPLYINGEGTSTFSLESLFNHHSKSISHPKMIVEFTGNPGWYAVQALPLLQNPDNENAISWAVAYYANTLTGYLAKTNAEITSRFDADTLSARTSMAIRQLQELQDAEGAWSWYKGMDGSRYITTQIMELLTRLQQLTGQPLVEKESNGMYEKALAYLARKAKEEYTRMKKWEKEGMKNLCPSEQVLHYLYICALNGNQKADKEVNRYFIDKLVQLDKIGMLTIYGKACASIILQDAGYEAKAKAYLQSVMEYSVYTDEMGRYFDTPRAEYSWYSYKIPTQVAVIEAIHRIANEEKTIEELKRWLLQQKRTQDWDTPIATADAVYALLNVGENVLTNTGECQIVLGKEKIRVTKNDTLAYVHQEIKGDVLDIRKVTVRKESKGIGWGAIYAEYWEDMDKIGVQGNALSIRKDVYKDGKPLGNTDVLKVGDKLTIRLTIKADRDMDFIEVKDERAACMEPVDVLSWYRWKDGLGYFQRTKDSSTSFYMDQLRKGTYTLSYEVYVNMAGTYQEGAATIQSVYAPEFSGYVGGNRICVE